jgi:hypothetical protein
MLNVVPLKSAVTSMSFCSVSKAASKYLGCRMPSGAAVRQRAKMRQFGRWIDSQPTRTTALATRTVQTSVQNHQHVLKARRLLVFALHENLVFLWSRSAGASPIGINELATQQRAVRLNERNESSRFLF